MKIGYTFNIGNYESFKIESSEYDSSDININLQKANEEIINILGIKKRVIPELEHWYNKLLSEIKLQS